MPETIEYYERLLTAYINNTCTPQQAEDVLAFLQQDLSNKLVLKKLQDEFNKAMEQRAEVPAALSDNLRKRLLETILPAPVIPFYRTLFFRVAAAACIIMVSGAAWFFFFNTKHTIPASKPLATIDTAYKHGATITLADGRIIALQDMSRNEQGRSSIISATSGQIAYDTTASNNTPVSYHTLTVPAGIRMVQLTLADGTVVWLNTASSLKYPTAFKENERRVELTGEAYFEVKSDAIRPFKVHTKNMTVDVLGTSFNVSAYDDDQQTKTVLVDGRVALSVTGDTGKPRKLLSPGQLGSVDAGTGNLSVTTVDTDEYTSWRKGYLILKQTPLAQIIKQLSRYYGVQIDAAVLNANQETFSGRLDLQKNIDEIMQLVCIGTSFMYIPAEKKIVLKN